MVRTLQPPPLEGLRQTRLLSADFVTCPRPPTVPVPSAAVWSSHSGAVFTVTRLAKCPNSGSTIAAANSGVTRCFDHRRDHGDCGTKGLSAAIIRCVSAGLRHAGQRGVRTHEG